MSAHVDVHPGARRMFGVKDLFTAVNALAGVVALALCTEGRWLWACYAVMAGYAADMVDGRVARALREANRFGAEFDTAADFVTQAVAPALIVYLVYRDAAAALGLSARGGQALGAVLAAVLIVPAARATRGGTSARSRSTSPGSVFPRPWRRSSHWASSIRRPCACCPAVLAGVVLIPALAALELSNVPFKNHRGRRRNFPVVRVLIGGFVVTSAATFLFAPRFAWDVLLFWSSATSSARSSR